MLIYSHAYNLHISLSFSFCYLLFSLWWLSISSPFSIFERWWNYDFVNDGGGGREIGCVWRLTDKKDLNLLFIYLLYKKALILSTKTWLCNLHCDNLVGFLFLKKSTDGWLLETKQALRKGLSRGPIMEKMGRMITTKIIYILFFQRLITLKKVLKTKQI